MAVTVYTSLLGFALPTTGDLAGTWGDIVNDEITSLVDSAIAGTTTLSADSDVTLTTTEGVANQSRQAILNCTGARTGVTNITAPAASKTYYVLNATTGGYAVVINDALSASDSDSTNQILKVYLINKHQLSHKIIS